MVGVGWIGSLAEILGSPEPALRLLISLLLGKYLDYVLSKNIN